MIQNVKIYFTEMRKRDLSNEKKKKISWLCVISNVTSNVHRLFHATVNSQILYVHVCVCCVCACAPRNRKRATRPTENWFDRFSKWYRESKFKYNRGNIWRREKRFLRIREANKTNQTNFICYYFKRYIFVYFLHIYVYLSIYIDSF